MEKVAIVFSEGGMSCAYSVGVTLGLITKYKLTNPDMVIGSSGSTAILAYFSAGQYEAGRNIWENLLSTNKFVSYWRFWKIMDIDYLVDEVFKKQEPLDVEAIKHSKIKLFISSTNLSTGGTEYFSNQDDILEALRASKAILLFYGKKVRIGKNDYVDGGISTSFADNINKAKELGATKIIAVDNINGGISAVLYLKLYKFFHPKLKKVNLGSKIEPDNRVFILKPSKKIPVTGAMDNNQQHLKETIKIGYDDVINNKSLEKFLEI